MLKFLTIACIGLLCQAHFIGASALPYGQAHQYPQLKQSNLGYIHSIIAPSNSHRKAGCNHCAAGHHRHQEKDSSEDSIKIQGHEANAIQTNRKQGCQCGHSHAPKINEKQACEKCNNRGCSCGKCSCDDKKCDGSKGCSKCSSGKCGNHRGCKQGGCGCSKHHDKGSKSLGQEGDKIAFAPILTFNPLSPILAARSMQ